ncbi:hypothetical protein LWI28_003672 [Acer negundo]|uniref:Uncharacterized protein n=1 Tax=Acer negundo TaxID=4023 RepID=A0AAD5JIA2_ACENE|nr:hypothetical protein LWI28_003672 [Acer negundo]KAK4854849.1 hypothetical protein QYF36_001855 [Acer negundo]
MGSIVPFQDLNLLPSPISTTTTTASLLTPKLEPKAEPLDEPIQTHQQFFNNNTPEPFFSGSAFPFFPNSQNTLVPEPTSDQDNVFSEYYRISELFRSAFSKRLQQQLQYADVEAQLDPNSQAIVSVNQDNQLSTTVVVPRRKYEKRSSELVRVQDLGMEDWKYFRDNVRRTRMLYDSLRILSVDEEDKRRGLGQGRRARGDLMAASVMRDHGLWLNRDKRIVGPIPGILIGDLFFFRMELCVVGLHGQAQAGIDYLPGSQSASGEPIATSIIVSGGYEDDEDGGDVLVYTGHGGQDKLNRQCEHQRLEGGNLALERSMHYGIEIRVIRGIKKYEGSVSNKVYVYDGLYKILDCWFDVGRSGFGVYKFRLVRIVGQPEMGSVILKFAETLRTRPLTVRPKGYLSLDISMQKEAMPVLLFNDIDNDHDPLYYEYLAKTVFPPFVYNYNNQEGGTGTGSGSGCCCVSGCTYGCLCAMKNGGEFAYDNNGSLLRGKPLIFECGPFCQCPPNCRNRVSQKGSRHRLEVFRSRETGYGVRSLDLIHAGDFICEYTGVVLTMEQAQIFAMNGDNLVYPNRFIARWAEWGDLSRVLPDYMPPSYPSIPPLDFAMDVSRMRNAACYISHSVTPNVLVQYVLYDHNNLMFPHIMLFALENIPPMRELSLDYGVGVAADEWTGKLAICN